MGKITAAIFTLVVALVIVWALTVGPWSLFKETPPRPPQGLVADWRFDHFEKGGFPTLGGMTIKIESMRFFDDGTYITSGTLSVQGPGAANLSTSASGKYTVNGNKIRFEQTSSQGGQGGQGALSVMDFSISVSVSGNLLKLTDPSYVAVFKKL